MNSLVRYIGEIKTELKKVVWPKRSEVVRLTTLVILISALVGIYIGGVDYIFTKLLESVVSR